MAGIIKAGHLHSVSGKTASVAFNLEDMTRKAEQMLEQVRAQANQIVAEAQQEADSVKQAAFEEGQANAQQEFQQAVQAEVAARVQQLVPAVTAVVEELNRSRQVWLEHWQARTTSLALSIAERVIRCELKQQPTISVELVREALQLAMGQGNVTLHVSEQDRAQLGEHITQIIKAFDRLGPTEVVVDPVMRPGDCRVSTEFGSIDQSIASQLQRIEEELSPS